MAEFNKVTVDKTYFDALLRRADFHTTAQGLGPLDPTNITISKVEYNSLVRNLHEYESLKSSLYSGGITSETLDLLTGAAAGRDQRKDSAFSVDQDIPQSSYDQHKTSLNHHVVDTEIPSRSNGGAVPYNSAPALRIASFGSQHTQAAREPCSRQVSHQFAESLAPDYRLFDADDSFEDGTNVNMDPQGRFDSKEKRTLYMSGFSDRTTYKDLVAILRGGKILSILLRPDRTATVTFLEGAAEFLAWAKRNDIYLHAKRIEIKWADRQFHLHGHVLNKSENGTSRNILIHNALDKGLTEERIREDMEHIHNLVLIDVTYRGSDAYVSTNSIHNALFARTCMMSRKTYKGCKIEFYRDECDAPLPMRQNIPNSTIMRQKPIRKTSLTNRFDLLDVETYNLSNEENESPIDSDARSSFA
ncbi:Hypothetical protein R9X50_00592600 [Acrodontium crateriforme]|uniref:RRM domain-containing protein n=1 Tax=Acrodontium crateriforme TaxID=150365 RepID=A0AAQ3M8Q1_9PEZI|nr:Hypothetical protein R9X50_00592600 [Acrodontium crateriforme]